MVEGDIIQLPDASLKQQATKSTGAERRERAKAVARGRRKMKAWLVTWEWASDQARRDEKVAAVFSPQLGPNRVREFVELLYMTEYYTVSERMTCALPKGHNPYPARFGQTPQGIPWTGEIECGHHPFLLARLVDDLTAELNADGKETVTWKERLKPWESKIGIWREGDPESNG
jgi:hypothetical protein